MFLRSMVNSSMYLTEIFEPAKPGYQDESEDNSVMHLNDLRKTRLTLAHLNQLRMANDIRKFEHEVKLKSLSKQYSPPAEAEAGLPSL